MKPCPDGKKWPVVPKTARHVGVAPPINVFDIGTDIGTRPDYRVQTQSKKFA